MIPMICDFCSQRPVVWSYHVFPIPVTSEVGGIVHCTQDEWAACAECKSLIDAGARERLVDRSVELHSLYPAMKEKGIVWEVKSLLTAQHDQFFDVKNGPGMAI